jgi:hypothetical protein
MSGKPTTVALAVSIVAMLGLTVLLPARQQDRRAEASASALDAVSQPSGSATLSALDHVEIQQLVRKYAWAIDGGDNYGYAFADLFTPDGAFVAMSPGGRTYRGRDELATLARGGTRGPTQQRHFTMNHVINATPAGVTGRVYVVVLDVGVVGTPNRVSHGGSYDDVYERTPIGWRFKQRRYLESKVDVWPAGVPGPVR